MSNKIAVVEACPFSGSPNNTSYIGVNHYRYVTYAHQVRTGTHLWGEPSFDTYRSTILLYDDMTIEDFLTSLTLTFHTRRNVNARTGEPFTYEGKTSFEVNAVVSGTDRLVAQFLGMHGDRKLYLVYKESYTRSHDALGYFSLSRVPKHGRSHVALHPQSARPDPNSDNNLGGYTAQEMLELFNDIDARVAPIMAPMVALLPEVK